MVKCGKIVTGTKLCIYGAELCALTDACSPLEAPPGVFLRVHANSARRAVWYAKLGYQPCSKAFPVSLSSLYHCGGLVGCVDVVIQRQYPFQVQYVYLLTKSYKIHNNCPCSVDGKDRWKVCVSVNSG
jgi:breast cancer 2 susceptibility protein